MHLLHEIAFCIELITFFITELHAINDLVMPVSEKALTCSA